MRRLDRLPEYGSTTPNLPAAKTLKVGAAALPALLATGNFTEGPCTFPSP